MDTTPPLEQRFDIVLVLDYFRSATAYLSLIGALSPRLRIGLYVTPLEADLLHKNGRAHKLFVDACVNAGAERIGEEPVETDLLIVQQRPYAPDVAARILSQIRARRRHGLMLLAMAGRPDHDAFLDQFGIEKVYVPNRRLFDFLLRRRKAVDRYKGVAVAQVGLPFARYPIFPTFSADYLVASPTTFSFRSERHIHAYLETVLALLDQIPPAETIVYKPHNGQERDYLARRGYTTLGRALVRIPGAQRLMRLLARRRIDAPGARAVDRLYTSVLYAAFRARVVLLSDVTDLAEFSLEAFLPGVRKGVIGGLSNTIWGALYFGLPFFNCVDVMRRDEVATKDSFGNPRSEEFLDTNLEFFAVPYCRGRLTEGARGADIVTEDDRKGCLVAEILHDLDRTVSEEVPSCAQ